ncbi:glycosyltransferase family 4 protein [Bacteroides reticulotermitis]|uniref:glycosyltransferase family 4 protein n=1 Tax=Bacteroides reticulotermitis TaxID=1133319 RepID=UPI003A83D85D
MTIIYLYRSLAVYGGIERIFIDKINYLAENLGYKIYIVTWEQGTHPIIHPLSPKATHIDLGILFYKEYTYTFIKRMWAHRQMEKLFFKKIQDLVSDTQADIVIGASCEFPTMVGMNLLGNSVRTILESHSMRKSIEKDIEGVKNPFTRLAFRWKNKQLHRLVQQMSAFVTLTRNDARDWSEITDAIVIPNLLHYYPPELTINTSTHKRVISAGRLTEQKGYDLLLATWSIVHQQHPDWTLEIYGDGEDREMLSKQIEEKSLQTAVYLHHATPDIYDKYKQSDFYVMSSRWEGFGLVLAEAMSCGIPCVSFDCPHGPSDIIKNGEDGLLVENGNVEQLAKNIGYLIEHEDIRMEMGRKARENVKRYLPENVMPQWQKLFESLILKN